ncbi:hypothetical protein BGZ59_003417 [Podila verticillata]|nr:hypothetical protein BGZ59_003417 [Podila verticillata]
MLIKNLAVVACLVTAAMAQNGSIFCQARYITNVATCIIGVKECNTVESFSAPSFRGILKASDFKSLADYEQEAEMAESGAPADK